MTYDNTYMVGQLSTQWTVPSGEMLVNISPASNSVSVAGYQYPWDTSNTKYYFSFTAITPTNDYAWTAGIGVGFGSSTA